MKDNLEVEKLLQDFELVNPVLTFVLRSIRELILESAPDSEEKLMYGGIIYSIPGRMFCGLFLRMRNRKQ